MNQASINDVFESLAARYRAGALSRDTNLLRGRVEPPAPGDLEALPAPGSDGWHALRKAGTHALGAGHVGVVILAGGMATRFQYDRPKGLYPIWQGQSFLGLKLQAVRQLGVPVPVFLMTSFATDAAVAEHLAEHDHFGLDPTLVHRFQQYRMPRLAPGGGAYVEDGRPSLAAPGHGDFPFALRESGHLEAFLAAGGRWLCFSNVDNLGATVDPVILGGHVLAGAQMTVEVAAKNPGDQGGAPARVDGRLQLVEGFAFPPGFDQDQIHVFNTANYVFDAAALTPEVELPWYVVEKQVRGETVVQFEHLAGDLSTVLSTRFVQVPREDRFLPVKSVEDVPGVAEILSRCWAAKLAVMR
ncbi:MAG: UTP--glucose-1-phosphate uridylyltransferase [Candidatus Sericytochromatia bacterium]|nr:UTP--glucose-1-phosphate uridylyltransferase [Candidatus Sericytochromatia bacterium]